MKLSEDQFIETLLAIKEDENLRVCFIRILELGAATQQVRINMLLTELNKLVADEKVTDFVGLLLNEQLAAEVLRELKGTEQI